VSNALDLVIRSQTEMFFDRKILSRFGQNAWKYRLMKTVAVGFNATVRQITEMSQWKGTVLD